MSDRSYRFICALTEGMIQSPLRQPKCSCGCSHYKKLGHSSKVPEVAAIVQIILKLASTGGEAFQAEGIASS
jgi:hypothetical protein